MSAPSEKFNRPPKESAHHGRQTVLFNDGWLFCEVEYDGSQELRPNPKGAPAALPFASSKWRPVEIPHDFLIADSRTLFRSAYGWYAKSFLHEKIAGRRERLIFDGIYMDSKVYVNGKQVWEWKNGYTGFCVDITDALCQGMNTVWVSCAHISPNSRWYSGAGIYRNIWRSSVEKEHILPNGIYIHVSHINEDAQIEIETECAPSGAQSSTELGEGGCKKSLPGSSAYVVHRIFDEKGKEVACGQGGAKQMLTVSQPTLWSCNTPYRYTLRSELWVDGQMKDGLDTRFGIRSTQFDPEKGFFLNERKMKINGVCVHHDHGALGAAFHTEAVRRQLLKMKEMGANAVRCAHNPMAPEFYALCDEIGLLVMSEFTDVWRKPKTKYDYARFFDAWVERDVESWIRRERNHPSIIMWSVGNEIYDTHEGAEGQKTLRRLIDLVKQHDPKGNARPTLCSNYMPWENTQKCADVIKLIGYNYAEKYYEAHHRAHPDWIIYGSETGSITQSRGIFHFPLAMSTLSDDDGQCSSLGNSRTSWGAKSPEACITEDRNMDFSLGQFVWTGWDYLGEPTPYRSKNSFFGLVDTAGFPKDLYYVFQSAWANAQEKPMLHLFPHWDFNEGQMIDVRACTNWPCVELFVNGKSFGVRQIDHRDGAKIIADWRVPYAPGYIEAVAYDIDGHIAQKMRRESFGDAVKIDILPERRALQADGTDLIYLQICVRDKEGRPVENANNRVEVCVEGAGRLVGLDNGNSADYDSFLGTSKRLFSGKLIAIIKAKTRPGTVHIHVSSPGLTSEQVCLSAVASDVPLGVCALETPYEEANAERPISEIPVRKMELSATRLVLSAEHATADVQIRLLPENHTYPDYTWRITDERGIDTSIAQVEPYEGGVRVRAHGDGRFALRCATQNGGEATERYSILFFEANGLGAATLDPYNYIYGGLYTLFGGEIGNGNERGFSTARDEVSYAGFERIDFGTTGSNEMTIDVFCLDDEPLPIELWEGEPGKEGSYIRATLIYQKPSIWNTYQAESYVLEERLTGVRTLSFRLNRKAHIRGFSFVHKNPAFEKRFAAECESVIGDSFERHAKAIHNIGNNVSILFRGMDFGAQGIQGIEVTGRTRNPKNTVQIRFQSVENDTESMRRIEFVGDESEKIRTQRFVFEPVDGRQDVTFVFLPGSAFDFESFRFL